MRRLVISALLLALASSASAQVSSIGSSNPLPKPPVKGDLDRIICEREERTGSRLQVDKVCMTALQWKDHQLGHREDLEKVQQVVNQSPSN
jgi:hypothetical protein